MRATVLAQVAALRLRTNNTAAVVRPRLENRPSPFLSLFRGGDTGSPVSPDYERLPLLVAPRQSLELRVLSLLTPPVLTPPPPSGNLRLSARNRRISQDGDPRVGVVFVVVARYPDH